ncbi:MAG TPA: hypothetical protein VKD90_18630 [Gemmataceae bacterium]|nr:hypothetical protein [Gemmataceae bacterium]
MRLAPLPLAAALLVSPAVRADDTADARAVIERAVKAHGHKPGPAQAVMTWKEKIALEGLGQPLDLDTEWTVQVPDKLRLQMTVAVQGQNIDLTIILNGEKMWFLVNGQHQEGDAPQLAELLTEMNRMWATSLTPLLAGDEFQLATAKEKLVNGKPAAGVAVRNGKRPVVTLYFDKETGLLVKREATVKDPLADDKEVLEEAVVSDYKEAGGRKYHTRVVVTRDGKPFYRSEVSMARAVEKPDPKLFDKPEPKP